MSYTPTNWVDGTTPLSAANLNNLETQYSEAVGDLTDGSKPFQVVPVSGLTGATAGGRIVGATTVGPPTSGTFLEGDFALDQTGNIWSYQPANAAETVNPTGSFVAMPGSSSTENATVLHPFTVSNPLTLTGIQLYSDSGGPGGAVVEVAIFNSSGTNLSGWTSAQTLNEPAWYDYTLPTTVTLQAGQTYYVAMYNSSTSYELGLYLTEISSLSLYDVSITFGTTGLYYTSGQGFGTTNELSESYPLAIGYTGYIPATWTQVGKPPSDATGIWTPASGTFNVAAGTIINVAAVPNSAQSFSAFATGTSQTYTYIGNMTTSGSSWLVGTSIGWAIGTAGTQPGGSQGAIYDGSYAGTGYFQIYAGYFQFVVTKSTATTYAGNAVRWAVS